MKEELTEKMHEEFQVDEATDLLHRCISLWCYSGFQSEKDPGFNDECEARGIPVDVAVANKAYCLSLKS